MKIVIDIDEDTYKDIKKGKVYSSYRDVPQESVLAIANGTPLPTDAVDRVTIKEYLESFGTAYELGKEKGLDIALDILDKYTEEGNEKIIRDLPSETPQPCADAVSRQSALDVISELNAISFYEAQEDSKECYYEIRNAIKQLQPVTPQTKTGHWITTRTFMHDGEYYCDRCKCDAPNNEKWDYCPNCGSYNGGEG